MKLTAKFKKINPDAIIPSFKKDKDSGFDLYATHDGVVKFGEVTVVSTGLKLQLDEEIRAKSIYIPSPRYSEDVEDEHINLTLELQIRPRSGLALKEGITVINSPGTVDNGFRGEIKIILSRLKKGEYYFKKGDRIAQGVVCLVLSNDGIDIEETNDLSETDRGEGGYGHTGK